MKRLKRVFLPAVLVLCMVLCMFPITANAATGTLEEFETTSNWTYSATLTPDSDSTFTGHYLLVVFRQAKTEGTPSMPKFTADDILYIDQVTVSDAPSVSFSDWAPKSYSGGSAWIIGAGLQQFIDWLEAHGVSFSGAVGYLNTAKTAPTAKLSDGTTEIELTVDGSTLSTGSSSIVGSGIVDGTYTLTISKKGYLPYTATVTVNGGDVTMDSVQLLIGDADGDGKFINANDLTAVLNKYQSKNADDIASSVNVNEDEYINANDLSAILGNYQKKY